MEAGFSLEEYSQDELSKIKEKINEKLLQQIVKK